MMTDDQMLGIAESAFELIAEILVKRGLNVRTVFG
jgi:hypothetical protein